MDIDPANGDEVTPLHAAVIEGHTDTALLLCERGAAINQANCDGATPLYVACSYGHTNIALLLCERSHQSGHRNDFTAPA